MTRKSGRVTQGKKASKLRLNKETVKDLDPKDPSSTKGGAIGTVKTVTCIQITQCMATCLTCVCNTGLICKK